MTIFQLYALRLESEIDLPGLPVIGGPADLSLVVAALPQESLSEPLFLGERFPGEKEGWLRLFRTSAGDRLAFHGVGDFLVQPERIIFSPSAGSVPSTAPGVFCGIVMAYWFELKGAIALHASAVELKGLGAVGFAAFNGQGKSSLAAELTSSGARLVTDDVLILEPSVDGTTIARPSAPQMRFRRATASHFLGDQAFDRLPVVAGGTAKCRVLLGSDFGAFSPFPGPMRALWVIERREDSTIEIVNLSPLEAVIEMTRHSFLGYLPQVAGWQGHRLSRLCALAEHIPILRLRYPSGFGHLAAVRKAILERMSTLLSTPTLYPDRFPASRDSL